MDLSKDVPGSASATSDGAMSAIEEDEFFIPESPWDAPPVIESELLELGWSPDPAAPVGAKPDYRDDRPEAPSEFSLDDPVNDFLMRSIRTHVRAACNVNSKPAVRDAGLRWIFEPNTQDKDGVDLEHACVALSARPTVVRARVMLQLWQAGIIVGKPLSILSVTLHPEIASEIEARIGFGLAPDLARAIWSWPSISALDLRAQFAHASDEAFRRALQELDSNGYAATTAARWYLVVRNPDTLSLSALRRFSYSRSIHVDY